MGKIAAKLTRWRTTRGKFKLSVGPGNALDPADPAFNGDREVK